MLVEIWCDKFMDNGKIRPKVKFRSGLNTILGDINASNSIGKTTFLLIVDFAFGGDDYIKSDLVLQFKVLKEQMNIDSFATFN